MKRKFKTRKLKKRTFPIICYVCGKEVSPVIKLKRIVDKEGKVTLKTITVPPLMIGKGDNGRPIYRHQEGKCEPGTNYYLKKVNAGNKHIIELFKSESNNKIHHKQIPNIDEYIEDADWLKHKKLRRRK